MYDKGEVDAPKPVGVAEPNAVEPEPAPKLPGAARLLLA